MTLAERVCELLPAAKLQDCPASRATRQAWEDWKADPTPTRAEVVCRVAWHAELYTFDEERQALYDAIVAWSRTTAARPRADALIHALATRYGKEA